MLPIEHWLDITQTAFLVTIALAVIYALKLLRTELRGVIQTLRELLSSQKEFERRIDRVWTRVEAIEFRQGVSGDGDAMSKLKRVADALNQALKEPPANGANGSA